MATSNVDRSVRISLAAKIVASVPILLMIYLVETYVPDPSVIHCGCEYYPAGRVLLCMLAASILSVTAVVHSIRPTLHRRIAPLLGVILLGIDWHSFVQWYDWDGLFNHGKAWAELKHAEMADGRGAMQAVEQIKNWISPNSGPYPVKRLTRSFDSKYFLRCSPSGQFLVYVWYRPSTPEFPHSRIQLRAVNRNGKNDRLLLPDSEQDIPNQTSPSFSPDGRHMIFEGGPINRQHIPWDSPKDVYLCDIDTRGNASNLRRVLSNDSFLTPRHSSWSPNGERIAFSHNDDLFMADLNGEHMTILAGGVDDSWEYYLPDICPDESRLAFIRANDEGAELCTIRSDGEHLTVLAQGKSILRPQWSPNGKWLLYYLDSKIWVVRPDGKDLRRLTSEMSHGSLSTWSSDGQSVIYVSGKDGGMDLYELTLPIDIKGK